MGHLSVVLATIYMALTHVRWSSRRYLAGKVLKPRPGRGQEGRKMKCTVDVLAVNGFVPVVKLEMCL